ncbi:MAG: tRNA threonylcarbamoyladenosine biosynthesis protein TsaE [Moorella sp. (in: firmicutes)]|uniref:tRNA (adenosine(37)-N6)-threonylcarbamoyltransferase complex ATPase subunit type 1 TsaE n=1 Tax=unclassified Neomoorella TaxID=2676739 RepID=UPI0010FFC1E1|nr:MULTISPECIES: tRNA (adenosine(37)-N6)-threonylcarbamoyltransferase complex ATPase subunit type 1 TsaE [unclassified Moorella (in: firmicutes)]MDK2817481.1 tRNA threonylcarbamoyladenosine biosynthesis protein TsaE [Moorella sp. (in: firmicutes)]MDK2894050.1 tRNA threonylcarbamoyladenosine biosynthesis protein TsaE [Moorella sp. (in: firmicutes)]GEA14086.1 tRNA (adenosine(37)-N6)-threonylcarbamoyltransferase complex ATPase subunit type 1 TsaE [Moorella sp. E308F]GEA18538.1 tRNA (adenosine(37)-
MTTVQIWLKNAEATGELGRILGRLLNPGDVIILTGELGAGKTTLAQGLAQGLGVTGKVTSPTFTLIQEHQGRLPFYHIDVYRLEDPGAALELGLEEYLYGQGVTVIEWGERLGELLPPEYLEVCLEYDLTAGRRATLTARGQRYLRILEELKQIAGPGA